MQEEHSEKTQEHSESYSQSIAKSLFRHNYYLTFVVQLPDLHYLLALCVTQLVVYLLQRSLSYHQ